MNEQIDRKNGRAPDPERQHRRRDFSPWEPDRPIPWGTFSVAIALAVWGGWMLWSTSADTPAPSMAKKTARPETPILSAFDSHCATCHQPNGVGVKAAVPPLAGSRFVKADPAVAVQIVLHGLRGPISVRGQVYDGRMPAFGGVLSDDQIAATLTEVRASWGNGADPVTAGFVAAQRTRFQDRGPWEGEAELALKLGEALADESAGPASTNGPTSGTPR